MIFYAIKHIPTGGYLPLNKSGSARGGTWVEPTKEEPPRLFRTAHGARVALAWWLKGGIEYALHTGQRETTPFPDRKKGDMEIVPIEII